MPAAPEGAEVSSFGRGASEEPRLNGGAAAAPLANGGAAPAAAAAAEPASPRHPAAAVAEAALSRLKDTAAAGRARTLPYAAGACGFGGLCFLAGVAPGLLPAAFLAFSLTAMPLRFANFWVKKWQFFTIGGRMAGGCVGAAAGAGA
jgi:hypothetical protein